MQGDAGFGTALVHVPLLSDDETLKIKPLEMKVYEWSLQKPSREQQLIVSKTDLGVSTKAAGSLAG